MRKVSTFQAAEILMKHAINHYSEHGITKRVQFQDIAKIENIDESCVKNGFNHLHFIELINVDTGGGYTLNPKKLNYIIAQSQAGVLKKEINIVNEFNIEGDQIIIQNVDINTLKQDFINVIEKEVSPKDKSTWEKLKSSSLFDVIVFGIKKFLESG